MVNSSLTRPYYFLGVNVALGDSGPLGSQPTVGALEPSKSTKNSFFTQSIPRKTNMPKIDSLKMYFSFPRGFFQVPSWFSGVYFMHILLASKNNTSINNDKYKHNTSTNHFYMIASIPLNTSW